MIQSPHVIQLFLFTFAGGSVLLAYAIHLAIHERDPKKYDLRGMKDDSHEHKMQSTVEARETEEEADPALSYRPVPDSIMKFAPNATRPGELTRTTKTYFFEKPKYTGETTRAERAGRQH